MTAERFNSFTLPQQCYYTVNRGVYLATFNDSDVSIDLYQVDNFYAEIFYMKGSTACCMARAYTHTVCLNKYLDQVSITALLELL